MKSQSPPTLGEAAIAHGLRHHNLDAALRFVTAAQPESPAIFDDATDRCLSYAELDARVAEVAAALRGSGISCGDAVGIHLPNSIDYIATTYAAWRLGAYVVPIPRELAPAEKAAVLHDIVVDTLVMGGEHEADVWLGAEGAGASVAWSGWYLRRLARRRDPPPRLQAVNPAFVRFTSGTTGAAKGVVLSHEDVLERIQAANAALAIGASDRVLWMLSMAYHFTVTIAGYLSLGAGIVLPRSTLTHAVLESARRHTATVVYGSPQHLAWMAYYPNFAAAEPSSRPLPSLRLAVSTTAPLDGMTAEQFARRFGIAPVQALGLIEVGLPLINVDFAVTRATAVGRPLPAYELRLIDRGLGPRWREVALRGPGFLSAYYSPWRERAEILDDEGWFRTGDIGWVDARGCLHLTGRVKDVINVAGLKVFPQEIEAVLRLHGDVCDVRVASKPHERLGEVPVAAVVPAEGRRVAVDELMSLCRQRLASYKIPLRIEVVEALPRTASGKISRLATASLISLENP